MHKYVLDCEIKIVINGVIITIPIVNVVEGIESEQGEKMIVVREFMQLKNQDYFLLSTLTTPISQETQVTNEYVIELATHLVNESVNANIPMEHYYFTSREDFERVGAMPYYYDKHDFEQFLLSK